MKEIKEILPSCLASATSAEKKAFFAALFALAEADGTSSPEELDYIRASAAAHSIGNPEMLQAESMEELLDEVKVIKTHGLALELIREMCVLAHADGILSDSETLLIGKVGLAMGINLEKIEQISNWVIDHIVWLEQAKLIFEE